MIRIKVNKSSKSLIIDPTNVTVGYAADQILKVVVIANGQTFIINVMEKEDPGPGIDTAWYTIKDTAGNIIIKEAWDPNTQSYEEWTIHYQNVIDAIETVVG